MISQKLNVLTLTILMVIGSVILGTDLHAQSKQIEKLNFQYKKGFKMHFSGERINYDMYNFPKSKQPAFMEYSVTGDKQKGKEDVLGLRSTQNDGKDTVSFDNFLYFNEQGMFYWIWDEAKKIKQKNKTQAISLPLRTGKTWDSYYNKFNAKMECISTDSVIKTPLGEFKTFVVSATFTNHQKGFDEEITVIDFYNEDIGQVETQMSTTAVYKVDGLVRKKLADVTLIADKFTKPD
jgi:hypothetical protein